jgi:hypothetical protein
VKTTVEIPGLLFDRARSMAAERGLSLDEFIVEALLEKLDPTPGHPRPGKAPWMRGFGRLRHLRKETARLQDRVDGAFTMIEPGDRE